MRFVRLAIVAALLAFARVADAQQASASQSRPVEVPVTMVGSFIVKTVPLHHLSGAEAAKLLGPYVQTNGGGVFEISPSVRAVTIREVPKIYAEMMTVLGQYDREPATVTLNFQLVAAENSNTRDPAVAGLDSMLRSVLKFSGYRLLSTSIANAGEHEAVSQTLAADGESLTLNVGVSDLRVDGSVASVHLNVDLSRSGLPLASANGRTIMSPRILSTGVTVPMGQTVVLGTASTENGQRALILTVRPQLAPAKK